MSGFKNKFNKANQIMSEKIGGVEPTKLNDELVELKRKVSVINNLVEDVQTKTKEYLQPNPALRAMAAAPKLSSKSKTPTAPTQPEGFLAEAMIKHGNELGTDLVLGRALNKMGESIRVLAEEKNALDTGVKQEFLDPFARFQNSELKEINHYRKKLHDARVDYDFKKRKLAKGGSYAHREELKVAEAKLEEFVNLTHMRMHNLLLNEVETVTQLSTLAKQLQIYHERCNEILKQLVDEMEELKEEADQKPRPKFESYYLEDMGITRVGDPPSGDKYTPLDSTSPNPSGNSDPWATKPVPPKPSTPTKPTPTPENRCQAIYDFQAENDGELSFSEGDIIVIIRHVDENWCEGKLNGRTGFFPSNYVQNI